MNVSVWPLYCIREKSRNDGGGIFKKISKESKKKTSSSALSIPTYTHPHIIIESLLADVFQLLMTFRCCCRRRSRRYCCKSSQPKQHVLCTTATTIYNSKICSRNIVLELHNCCGNICLLGCGFISRWMNNLSKWWFGLSHLCTFWN